MIAALVMAAVASGSAPHDLDALDLGTPEVSAAASPSEVRLGQEITIVVTATFSAGVEVNLPDPLFPAGAPLEVAHRESSDRARGDGRRTREWQIKTYAWELGEFDIPPISVTFTAGGKAATVATNTIPIRVVGVLGDADDPKLMRAMAPPVPLWRRSWLLAWLAGGGAATLAAFLYYTLFYRRRRRKHKAARDGAVRFGETPLGASAGQEAAAEGDDGDPHRDVAPPVVVVAPPKPAEPAIVRARRKLDRIAEEALARLRALEQSGRLDSDRRGAYREMVAIVRDYLSARYDVDALELTTRELCEALMFRSVEGAGLTRAWLADCDVVKYAGVSASADEVRRVLDGACWLIDRTSPGASGAGGGAVAPGHGGAARA